jgi:hypothetical protein
LEDVPQEMGAQQLAFVCAGMPPLGMRGDLIDPMGREYFHVEAEYDLHESLQNPNHVDFPVGENADGLKV